MEAFFDFTIWCASEFVAFLFDLPFMDNFTFAHFLVAVTLLAVVITALVSSISVAKLSDEARSFNDREGKKG